MRAYQQREVIHHILLWVCLVLIVAYITGCSSDDDSDFAGSTTGPGVEINCLKKRQANLDRFPTGVGDTEVDIDCGARAPATTTP
ncbi:MAG TPA: hypothetical protein VJ301_18905 [Propionibacteriaceae bacterium]|nr:hypothetical protein [Propionibacteriaceae bacterium]